MAGAAVRESATFAGRADQVGEARAFVGRLLGPLHPCGDVAVLLASEMVTNSLLHGGSSVPGEAVTVTVVIWDAGVRVEVTGRKADGVPVLRRPDDEAEGSPPETRQRFARHACKGARRPVELQKRSILA
jgi:anti-sigma regulatory factor (Ser/Thr protein kinase)